ncbi:MAG: class I SAM-dependent methyltransferase, partial [Promethearchaeota archaeon]
MNRKERKQILSDFNYIFQNEINYYGKTEISSGGSFNLEGENFFRHAYLKFKELLGTIRGKTILDVGCGKGSLSFYLTKRGANVTAIDLSQNYINFCQKEKKRRRLNVDFRVMNAQIPDFEDESFDIIVGFRIIHHLPDINLFFRQCKRIL